MSRIHDIRITPTGDKTYQTGRPLYRVICHACEMIIHESTSGPATVLQWHMQGEDFYSKPLPGHRVTWIQCTECGNGREPEDDRDTDGIVCDHCLVGIMRISGIE